jgi:hypothetical protein
MPHLGQHGVGVDEASIEPVRTLREQEIKTAVVSSSKNCAAVLEAADKTWRRHAGRVSRQRTPWGVSDTSPGIGTWPPPISPASEMGWWGARHGRVVTHAVRSPVRPATLWMRVVSMASAKVMAGRMVVSRRANIDLPAPGGDMVSPPATGMTSPWSQQGRLEIFNGWRQSGVPPARDSPLIARACLNIRLAPAASPAPLQGVGLQVSSWSPQAWCRLTRTRPRLPILPA